MRGPTVGTARTAGELIEVLRRFDPDTPVCTRSLSHTWPADVVNIGTTDAPTLLLTFDG